MSPPTLLRALVLSCWATAVCARDIFSIPVSNEHSAAPRAGTSCRLLQRDVLVEAGANMLAVHRLRFELPVTASGEPACCRGEGSGMVHVHVRAPDADYQHPRINPYSATLNMTDRTFELVVKIYPGGPPTSPGVSAYLGKLAVGASAHVPEIRSLDWYRTSRRVGMLCFGVGLTECIRPATVLLAAGAEVRMIVANRNAAQAVLLERVHRLLREFPTRFRMRHFLSQSSASSSSIDEPAARGPTQPGQARTSHGRVDAAILAEELGGAWLDGEAAQHFLVVGTSAMEQEVFEMLIASGVFPPPRGHPDFLLIKGPVGHNSAWEPLSPPVQEEQRSEL